MGTADNEKLTVSIDTSYSSSHEAKKYPPVLGDTIEYYSTYGVFVVDSVSFTGTPGQNYKLQMLTSAIDMSKPSNKEYHASLANSSTLSANNFPIDI